jgi:hypothetical protein
MTTSAGGLHLIFRCRSQLLPVAAHFYSTGDDCASHTASHAAGEIGSELWTPRKLVSSQRLIKLCWLLLDSLLTTTILLSYLSFSVSSRRKRAQSVETGMQTNQRDCGNLALERWRRKDPLFVEDSTGVCKKRLPARGNCACSLTTPALRTIEWISGCGKGPCAFYMYRLWDLSLRHMRLTSTFLVNN